MILTGKTKEEFLKYLDVEEQWFNDECVDLFANALIIEWFDSVGFFISNPSFNDTGSGYQRGFECEVYDEKNNNIYEIYNDNDVFESRQEATEKAIIKANEIYNLNN